MVERSRRSIWESDAIGFGAHGELVKEGHRSFWLATACVGLPKNRLTSKRCKKSEKLWCARACETVRKIVEPRIGVHPGAKVEGGMPRMRKRHVCVIFAHGRDQVVEMVSWHCFGLPGEMNVRTGTLQLPFGNY